MIEKQSSKRPCPVCETKEGMVLTQLTYALFDDLSISGKKTLLQCRSCGMLFDDVDFNDDLLQEYYRKNTHYAASIRGGSGSDSMANRERYDRILDLLQPVPQGVIIDFGCGQGGFVAHCIRYGIKAIGIEPSVKSCEIARETGLPIYKDLWTFITENPAVRVCAIVLSHVLEHLMRPKSFIFDFAQLFKDALIYAEVPDAGSYLASHAIRWHEMYFEHLNHFRKQDLAEFARRSGIETITQGKVPFSRSQNETQCLYLLGRLKNTMRQGYAHQNNFDLIPPVLLPTMDNILKSKHPMALWGVSQYAMLLLGCYPELMGQIKRLFDASPAKNGRRINNFLIEPPSNLSSLPADYLLLIPGSILSSQMLEYAANIGFEGQIIKV